MLLWVRTWSVILREDHRLVVIEKRLLRRIFAPRKEEITRGWRKFQNEKPDNL
jgi:hypothetical protein